jgi:RNA-binding protein 26
MRGADCQYEHSDDVIIPTPEMMFAQMQNFMGPNQRGGFGGRGRGGRGRGGPPMPFDPHMGGMPGMPPMFFPGPGGPGGRGGRGGRPAPPPEFALGATRPPRDRNGNTLLITDVPRESCNMAAITEYFSQFGDVTSVAVEGHSRRALVSFTSNAEAYQAWKSDAAVFGNRHVKVLWHKPLPGHGAAGQKALDASKTLLENMKRLEAGEDIQGNHQAKLEGPESRLRKTLAELETRERQQKRETLIAEQKVLFARAGTASQEDKMDILKRLREIKGEMAAIDNPPKVEMSEKDKLDAQLAKHGMETAAGDEEELLRLNAQLSALRDKVSTSTLLLWRLSFFLWLMS